MATAEADSSSKAAGRKSARSKVAITCPRCKRDVQRINRTALDKVIGVLVPVRRYKCYGCFWEGLRVHHS